MVVGSGGSAGTGSGGGATTTPSTCKPPLTDLGGGWEQCGNRMVHRASLGACSSRVPRAEPVTSPDPGPYGAFDAGIVGACNADSHCTDQPYGHCEWGIYLGATYCDYGCVTNADCDPGYVCLCGDPVGACMLASCATDAECGAGFLCSDYEYDVGCGGRGFSCQTAADSCAAASDCDEGLSCARGYSPVMPDVARSCMGASCVIGRPFLIAGYERLASEAVRSDWYPPARTEVPAAVLDVDLRDAIRRGWLEQALMEHASVAAFARFSLQLLALGAPADLLSSATSAMTTRSSMREDVSSSRDGIRTTTWALARST